VAHPAPAFLRQVDEQRSLLTRAMVNELLDSHPAMLDDSNLDDYQTFVRNHIRPLLGELQLARIDGRAASHSHS
jgi:integrase